VEISTFSEVFKDMSVESYKSPEENDYFLEEGNYVETLRKVGGVGVDYVLEEFAESIVEGVKVHSAMNYSH
jgi:hypothetical protein